jgi:hypothetical protein
MGSAQAVTMAKLQTVTVTVCQWPWELWLGRNFKLKIELELAKLNSSWSSDLDSISNLTSESAGPSPQASRLRLPGRRPTLRRPGRRHGLAAARRRGGSTQLDTGNRTPHGASGSAATRNLKPEFKLNPEFATGGESQFRVRQPMVTPQSVA